MSTRLGALSSVCALLLACGVAAAQPGGLTAADFPSVDLSQAEAGAFTSREGEWRGARTDFGTLAVPENRGEPGSRLIAVPVLRFHSPADQPLEPVFMFHGGPGMTNFQMRSPYEWLLLEHDVVVIGYRGADGPEPLPSAEFTEAVRTTPRFLSPEGLQAVADAMQRTLGGLQARGVDAAGYGILDVVEDAEAAREALGYERIHVCGGSWGGVVAFGYCAAHRDRVGRCVMVVPGMPWNVAFIEPSDDTLNYLNEQWQRDESRAARCPDIVEAMRRAIAEMPASYGGMPLDRDRVALATAVTMGNQSTRALVIDAFIAAGAGDYSGLALATSQFDGLVGMISWTDLLSKTWSTDAEPERDFEGEIRGSATVLGAPVSLLAWGLARRCGWPTRPLPDWYVHPEPLEMETLIVVGSLDDGAKPAVERIAPRFTNATVVMLENMGHGDVTTLQEDASTHMQATFLRTGEVDRSLYVEQDIGFTPGPTLQETAPSTMPPAEAGE